MQITKDESARVLKIAGKAGIGEAEELRTALRDFVEGSCGAVDLSGIEACDTTALQLLCSARKTAGRLDKPFQLAGLSGPIEEAAAALGLSLTEGADAV